ncbi:MAG: ubiquitin-like protein [Candidatus Bathyarchaeia archaeon]
MSQPEKTNEPMITITIRTVDGETWTNEFNIHEPIKSILQKSLAHFGIQPAPGIVFHFLYEGRLLDESKTLEQEAVKTGSTLVFGTEAQVGQ